MKVPWANLEGIQHPEKPWWRLIPASSHDIPGRYRWRRKDGQLTRSFDPDSESLALIVIRYDAQELTQIDQERPLPAPEPHVGQVWFIPGSNGHPSVDSVQRVSYTDEGEWCFVYFQATAFGRKTWPPEGGALLEGRGAPWMRP